MNEVGFTRVTGWGKPTSTGVKELIQTSAPFGYLCKSCSFDLKTHGKMTPPMDKLF